MSKKKANKSKFYKRLRRGVLACLGTLVVVLAIGYIGFSQYYKEHFYAQTFINGMDCSNLSVEEAHELINNSANTYVLTISERGEITQQIAAKDIDLEYKYEKDINTVLENQSAYAWIGGVFSESKVENPYKVTYDKEKLENCIKALSCFDEKQVTSPTNAKISDYDKEMGFTIIEETQGNEVDADKVEMLIQDAVNNMLDEVSLEEADCYKKPSITSENPKLVKAFEEVNTYMGTVLTFQFGDKTEIFDKEDIGPAIKIDKSFIVKEFVTNMASTYDTQGGNWKFKTSYGDEVTVKGGDYGWKLDQDKELEEVMASIKAGEQVQKEPVGKLGSMSYDKQTIGDTYVEINIKKQHMFFYKNGKKIVEGDIVTGKVSAGHDTPTGVYYLKWKQKNRTLKGTNDNGTKYSSFVNYWMPFNGGIGLHDATWRSKFGGTRYLYGGSHGCVNLPLSVAKKLYEAIPVNTPIVVY